MDKLNNYFEYLPEELEAMVEDDCYIYTYIGGTAYLSADLPNSFFRYLIIPLEFAWFKL